MKFARILLLSLLLLPRAVFAATFDSLLAEPGLWSLDQSGFEAATKGLPFAWTSEAHDSARAARRGMTLFERPVVEVIARFSGGKVDVVSANFYARGDSGDLGEGEFRKLLTETMDAITRATGAKFTTRGKDVTNAVKAEGVIWTTAKSEYLLEYSFTKESKAKNQPFRAEFVRLEVRKGKGKPAIGSLPSSTPGAQKFAGAANLKKDAASGDVWIPNVPMVDQGQKGYCVVASTERVMRYYGRDVDENELAQIANSDSAGGTSTEGIRIAVKKVATRLRVKLREHEKMDVKEILGLIKDYNRAAKRAGAAQIPDQGYMLNVPFIYAQMKPEVLKDARTHNKADLTRFIHDVQGRIDIGVPLLWSVHLGLIKEPEIPQANGGHMRLIIGYNLKTQEILYSDSWGRGHELKRMKADDAWTITSELMSVEPL